jgi:two-component system chemotaxis sensor kinase CheA
MSDFDMSNYREMFLEEAEELFESADNILLEAEDNQALDEDNMNSLFRDVHTLKGSGASVELKYFAEFTHDVETLMDKLRNHDIEFVPSMATILIECMDVMKEILELEVADEIDRDSFDIKTASLLSEVKEYIAGGIPDRFKDFDGGSTSSSSGGECTPSSADSSFVDDGIPDEDAFGFFEPELESKQKSLASQESDVGFFDEASSSSSSDKQYGLFSESDESSYGLFSEDKKPGEQPTQSSKPATEGQKIASGDSFSSSKDGKEFLKKNLEDVNMQARPDSEAFGFFDKDEPATSSSGSPQSRQASSAGAKKQPSGGADKKVVKASSNTIRVNLDKIDVLMNNVGDLVITNAMLGQYATSIDDVKVQSAVMERLDLLDRHIREMQDSIMGIRMVPMESVYSKFPKVVRDISKKLSKKVEFKHSGDNVEIDKAMIEGLTDPLMHIIRNSLDHGLETPDDRKRVGKPETGVISIDAEQSNGQIMITIKDDGKGIDVNRVVQKSLDNGIVDDNQLQSMTREDKMMLIFGAGVSTADKISDISGRGVGMDVVKTNINKLGGVLRLDSELGLGTTITIVLPLTLAILDGLDIAVGNMKYILPLNTIVESLQPKANMIQKIGDGTQELLMLREEFVPIVKLNKLFGIKSKYDKIEDGMLIVVQSGNAKVAIFVDEFLHQHQVVVKPLDKNFRSVDGIGAATVRGDGSIGLILDIMGIIEAEKISKKDLELTA